MSSQSELLLIFVTGQKSAVIHWSNLQSCDLLQILGVIKAGQELAEDLCFCMCSGGSVYSEMLNDHVQGRRSWEINRSLNGLGSPLNSSPCKTHNTSQELPIFYSDAVG